MNEQPHNKVVAMAYFFVYNSFDLYIHAFDIFENIIVYLDYLLIPVDCSKPIIKYFIIQR